MYIYIYSRVCDLSGRESQTKLCMCVCVCLYLYMYNPHLGLINPSR